MKSFTVSFIATVLAFTAGLVTASSWNSNQNGEMAASEIVNAAEPCPPPPPAQPYMKVASPSEFDFAQGRLKVVPERVQLKSESLHYDIDVKYPQLVTTFSTEGQNIQRINQHVKEAATKLYQWPLTAKADVYETPGMYKIVNFTYEVTLATESYLSISFVGYSYANGMDYPSSQNFAVNYDLASGKPLKLSDIFKRDSKYLEFISRHCMIELSREPSTYLEQGLAPIATNFENWHFTSNGITFGFAACKVRNCADGDQTVQIPFTDLKPILNPDIPGELKITYP